LLVPSWKDTPLFLHTKGYTTADQNRFDGIEAWGYIPAHHRRAINQAASRLKWEMSDDMV
jgi:hypothetical protein